jgi:hypothetical protein
MKNSDLLYKLIKSLNSSEKRFLKTYLSGTQNNISSLNLRIFELLHKTEESVIYSQNKKGSNSEVDQFLVKNLNGRVTAKNQSTYIYRLYSKILMGLRIFHAEKTVLIQLQNLRIDIVLLLEKNLIDHALKQLDKAILLAKDNYYNMILSDLISLKRKLIRRSHPNKMDNILNELKKLNQYALAESTLQIDIQNVYEPLHLEQRQEKKNDQGEGEAAQKAKELIDQIERRFTPLGTLNTSDHEEDYIFKNLKSRCDYLFLQYSYFKEDKKSAHLAFEKLKEALKIFEDNPHFQKEYIDRYSRMLYNFMIMIIKLNKLDLLQESIRKMERLVQKEGLGEDNYSIKFRAFQTKFTLSLNYLLSQKKYEQAYALVPEIVKDLETFKKDIPTPSLIPLYHNLAMSAFLVDKFNEARDWIKKIEIMDERRNTRYEVQLLSRILHLLILFEQEHFILIYYSESGSVIRALEQPSNRVSRLSKFFPSFIKLVKGIKSASNTISREHRNQIFCNLHLELKKELHHPRFQIIIDWIEKHSK